ncbi:MAG: hypothetical protein V4617_07185 [Gemmatimonadota bacterium]
MTLLLTATATVGRSVSAQGSASLPPGTRVRVGTMHGALGKDVAAARFIGTLAPARGDSLVVQIGPGDSVVVLPLSAIGRLETSVGVRSHPWRGLFRGAVIGGGAGALLGLMMPPAEGGFIVFNRTEQALMLGTLLGTLGGGVGLAVGAIRKSEDWREVPQPARVRIAVSPARSGMAVFGQVTF